MQLDLRDPAVRQQSGLAATVTHRAEPSVRDKYHRSLDESKKLIITTVVAARRPLSRADIAAALKRRKSRHLTDMIQSLVWDGMLLEHVVPYRGSTVMYLYTPVN